jgi:hypothetical protein
VDQGVEPDHVGGAETALLGRPDTGPNTASISSIENPSSTILCRVYIMPKMPMRLAMKLGVSLPKTIPLPSLSAPKRAM